MGRLVSFERGGKTVAVHALFPRGVLTQVLTKIGELLVFAAQSAIYEQRRGAVAFPPRRVPNVLGVLSDLEAGRPVHPSRLTPRKALYATGRLYNSFGWRIVGRRVTTTSTAPYVKQAEEGGTATVTITPRLRASVRGFLGRGLPGMPAARARLAAAVRKDSVTVTWPARPFSGIPLNMRSKVTGLVRSRARRLSLGLRG